MPVKCYLGQPYEHQAEEIAARALAYELRQCLNPDEIHYFVCNFRFWRDCQVDALLITPYAITVLDWKDMDEPMTVSEDGPWRTVSGKVVLGGAQENPFQQIKRLRLSVSGYIKKNARHFMDEGGQRIKEEVVFSHVSAALIFIPTQPTLTLAWKNNKQPPWLSLTGLKGAASAITTHRSKLNLRPHEAEAYIERGWRCRPWAELDALLPQQAAGTLWYRAPIGTLYARQVLRAFTLGRGAESDWPLPDVSERVSRQHAQIQVVDGGVLLCDLDSLNGTYLNGIRLDARCPVPLKHGDVIVLGSPRDDAPPCRLEFVVESVLGDGGTTRRKTTIT